MPGIDIDKELNQRLEHVIKNVSDAFGTGNGFLQTSDFYEVVDRSLWGQGLCCWNASHARHSIAGKISKIFELKTAYGFEHNYYYTPQNAPDKYIARDIAKFKEHSNAIKDLLENKLKESPELDEKLIQKIAKEYCRETFGDKHINKEDYRAVDIEAQRIDRLAFWLTLPLNSSFQTVGTIDKKPYTLKQIFGALNYICKK
ncbi:MAG: hypothetical protein V1839_03350 [archaeon]